MYYLNLNDGRLAATEENRSRFQIVLVMIHYILQVAPNTSCRQALYVRSQSVRVT